MFLGNTSWLTRIISVCVLWLSAAAHTRLRAIAKSITGKCSEAGSMSTTRSPAPIAVKRTLQSSAAPCTTVNAASTLHGSKRTLIGTRHCQATSRRCAQSMRAIALYAVAHMWGGASGCTADRPASLGIGMCLRRRPRRNARRAASASQPLTQAERWLTSAASNAATFRYVG